MKDRKEYRRAFVGRKKLIKKLFWINLDGKLNNHLRIMARKFVRLAAQKREINGNVFNIAKIQETLKYLRHLAEHATPEGELIAYTLDEVNAYHIARGETPWTAEQFFGLDKKQRSE